MERAYLPDGDFAYEPVAIYHDDADSLEYVRRDEPSIYRRIDGLLTLVLSMRTREPVGFQLKGFRHFYLKHMKKKASRHSDNTFLELITVLEEAVRILGDEIFSESEIRAAYMKARDIAEEDRVNISGLSFVA